MQTITWKKGLFSSTFNLLKDGKKVGELKVNPWSGKAHGILNEKEIRLKRKGVFSNSLFVKSDQFNAVIKEKSFSQTSYITTKEKTYKFLQNGFWKQHYILSGGSSNKVKYKGHEMAGRIELNGDIDESLVLTGLYLSNSYWQKAAILIIIIVIIIAT